MTIVKSPWQFSIEPEPPKPPFDINVFMAQCAWNACDPTIRISRMPIMAGWRLGELSIVQMIAETRAQVS